MKLQKPSIRKLNRYTSLPVLLDLLKRKKLTLLDPATWEDRNDSCIMAEYKKRRGVKRVLAICFSHGDETIHHWKCFSDGISGCCIEFDAKRLLEVFDSNHLKHDKVSYKKLRDLTDGEIVVNEIPFTKRWPYRCEEEYRVIREDNEDGASFDIDIDLRFIRKITISQRMPSQVFDTIRDHLREVSRNPEKKIWRSTLFENSAWIAKFRGL